MTNPQDCPLEISLAETRRLLDTAPDRVRLIDVREPDEVAICRIDGAAFIPMRQIPETTGRLPPDRHLLVLCHHGQRSLRVAEYLRQRGFPAVSSVQGGIDAWAATVDPAMSRY